MKALVTLAAELGIRRETMDKLEVPKHYEPGAEFLRLSADIDKEGNGRPLWLSPRARKALEERRKNGEGPQRRRLAEQPGPLRIAGPLGPRAQTSSAFRGLRAETLS